MTDTAEASAALRRMADAIDANQERPFGGVFVLIPPPDGTGKFHIVETMLIASSTDSSRFWGLLKGEADLALRELDAAERQQGLGFGRR